MLAVPSIERKKNQKKNQQIVCWAHIGKIQVYKFPSIKLKVD